jgi:hypothetical protein
MNEKPKLRPIQAIPFRSGGERLVCLRDGSGVSKKTVLLAPRAFMIAALFDGEHTLDEIRAEYAARFGEPVLAETIQDILRQLQEARLVEDELP